MSQAEMDRRVREIYEQTLEIEERLIPTGLHVFGRAPGDADSADLLRAVASFDRPEAGIRSLTKLIEEGLSSRTEGILSSAKDACEASLDLRERVGAIAREAIEIFMREGSTISSAFLRSQAGVAEKDSLPGFELLSEVRAGLMINKEIDGLVSALRGEYIEPGPGADIVQNPSILPTGRNTHAVNPYSTPSDLAYSRAESVVKLLLEKQKAERGQYPRAMALVLWGLDNIKTGGEGVAQALRLLGVRPLRDSLNRVTDVEPIPLAQLQRPRIDVVMTVSGIFRDLFSPTMLLLDKAVRCVAGLDEPPELNFVRANIQNEMKTSRLGFDEAALRVFSNAPGNYGANVNFMVLDSQWERSETLGELFVTRKCFAYGRGRDGRTLEGREARDSMGRALSRVEAAYQNLDSFEIGVTDVDHYFEYLGGVSRAVESRAGERPRLYLADALSQETKVRSLEETIKLETRTKTLNPKWYEGMLKHGFRGVAEIESHVTNTFGWSATADAVEGWIYDEVAGTFVLNEEMLARLRELNPHSALALVARLLEAEGRGFWRVDAETLERLRMVYASIEDQIEGAA